MTYHSGDGWRMSGEIMSRSITRESRDWTVVANASESVVLFIS